MCGISLILSTDKPAAALNVPLEGFANEACFVGTVRGNDSTGLMYVNRNNDKLNTLKLAVDGALFVQLSKVNKVLKWCEDYKFLAIHNRAGTKGGRDNEHAHPFTVGDITLIHNGTIHNQDALCKGHDVDSEAICAALSEVEPKKAGDVLSKINGAFVLMWHDARDNSFNLTKNNERPFHMAWIKDSEVMLGCSEKGMLAWLAARNKITIGDIVVPKLHTIMKWDLGNKKTTSWDEIPYEAYTYNYPVYNGQRGNTYGGYPATLHSLGLVINQVVEFDMYSFEPYSNESAGILYGIPDDDDYEIKVFNVSSTLIGKNERFRGLVSHVMGASSPQFPTIVLKDVVAIKEPAKRKKSELAVVINGENVVDLTEAPMVLGPGEVLIHRMEFNKLVKGGCCVCGEKIINPRLTRWVNGYTPICIECDEKCNHEFDQVLQQIETKEVH